ncbi:MAG: hypothetical protein ABH883_04985 [Candidatus Omnitrophota bacterium]
MAKKYKRTQLLVSRKFQIKYIALILLFMFSVAIVTGYTVYVTTWIMFGEKLAAVYPQGLLMDIVNKVNLVLLMRLIFLCPVVILVGLILSHRIAGPIFSIQRFLRMVTEGNYDIRLRLREKDELKEIASAANKLAGKLQAEKNDRRRMVDDIKRGADRLEAAVIAGNPDRERLLREILLIRGELEKIEP